MRNRVSVERISEEGPVSLRRCSHLDDLDDGGAMVEASERPYHVGERGVAMKDHGALARDCREVLCRIPEAGQKHAMPERHDLGVARGSRALEFQDNVLLRHGPLRFHRARSWSKQIKERRHERGYTGGWLARHIANDISHAEPPGEPAKLGWAEQGIERRLAGTDLHQTKGKTDVENRVGKAERDNVPSPDPRGSQPIRCAVRESIKCTVGNHPSVV